MDRILHRRIPVEIENEELGPLRLRGNRWEGEFLLKKPRAKLHLALDGDAKGPSTRSTKEVTKIRRRWPKFVRTTIAKELWKIDDECRDDTWAPRTFSRDTILEVYQVVGASLSTSGSSVELKVDVSPPDGDTHTMTLQFVDWKPAGMHLDG